MEPDGKGSGFSLGNYQHFQQHPYFFKTLDRSTFSKPCLIHLRKLLVGGFNPFEKYSSKWIISRIFGVKIKNIWNHHPDQYGTWESAISPGTIHLTKPSPASKWPFDSPYGGHVNKPWKDPLWVEQRGHELEEPGIFRFHVQVQGCTQCYCWWKKSCTTWDAKKNL